MSVSAVSGSVDQRPKAVSELTEESVSELVDRFYAKVREDDQIGPVFNDAVQNWDAHLALLKDFWYTVLFGERRYRGNPLLAHFNLPIEDKYFDRWLGLFGETAREILTPEAAAVVVSRATAIGSNMRRVLAGYRG